MSSPDAPAAPSPAAPPKYAWLPPVNSTGYYLLLGAVAIFILGPLGGITAAYMNFSLGFFVGGQVLAGILGSAVTYGYGPDGKHGANYMQTMAASVAGMCGMAVLVQAMHWMGMEMPATWKLTLFMMCIGMFGVGVGMLWTPILVDKLQLEYPSGHAVANILRALTDVRLLKRSIGQLGGGTGLGIVVAALADKIAWIGDSGISTSNIGAGMVVGSRIAVPGLMMAVVGSLITPYLKSIGWLHENDPFRKIGFLIALAMIMGAAIVDLSLIGIDFVKRLGAPKPEAKPEEAWKQTSMTGVIAWVIAWGIALALVATQLMGQPLGYILFAMLLSVIFVFINGIANGISDSNPISSAFVISVLLMSAIGLENKVTALLCASVLLISCSTGVDMQQDRSTGWRLGTPRNIQFRYQVVGIVMGAVLCVGLANLFMGQFPVLQTNLFEHSEVKGGKWSSAMTYKFVGAIRDLGNLPPYKVTALEIGLAIGLVTEVFRKVLRKTKAYTDFIAGSKAGFAFGWVMDSILLSSPYASSFGGFVELPTTLWYAAGGVFSSAFNTWEKERAKNKPKSPEEEGLPEDMSATSLSGGGLIAGESLYYLYVGLSGLVALMFASK
jgi:uncharacterized oligopeptide transporter (OPT) family protein